MPYAEIRDSDITALIPDLLYRVGSVVPADHLSWLPGDTSGFEPLNCYLYLQPDTAVFIDTNPAICRPAVEQALTQLAARRQVLVFPTRNEAECIGNLGYLLAKGRDARLLFGGGGGILEWVNHPDAPVGQVDNFLGVTPIDPAANGTSTAIGGLRFDWMNAAMKEMFLTQWAYEASTKVLFTSDFFGWNHLSGPDQPVTLEDPGLVPSAPAVATEIASRINWLPGAYCPELLAAYDDILQQLDVAMIAPVHGAVIAGPAAVERNIAVAREALGLLTSAVPA
jgi:hypothetical protein